MGFCTALLFFLAYLSAIFAQNFEDAHLVVNGTAVLAETDADYICATMDWWPHDKCNYNQCPWGYSSAINLDLSEPLLAKAIQAFGHLRIRIGGSLQDQVKYDVGLNSSCPPFAKVRDRMFGFSGGCLHMKRWDELNHFFSKTGAIVTFGLNALSGRHQIRRGVWGGDWDSSNAHDFIQYTVSKGYQIDSWEFGNELSGIGIGASVGAEQYGRDLINLKDILYKLYHNFKPEPFLVAPGGFYDNTWFAKLLRVSGSHVVDVMTHHIYNLGAGVDPKLVSKILDPHYLSRVSDTFSSLKQTIQRNGPWASAWVGESGGAYNSGGRHVSDTFINSFCAMLWHQLMGKGVLAVDSDASSYLRYYAHCSKGRVGITLLLINLSNQTSFNINVQTSMHVNLHKKEKTKNARGIKKTVSWIGGKASDEALSREEYHLTPADGNIRSKTMLLNGRRIELTAGGDIPTLLPSFLKADSGISISPLSMKFIVFPNFNAPGCR
ncbi:hypothetical protein RJ639_022446 [Escallonia herrerae]|uniref:Heparanase-like protein 1 n=1 Tax=Escallonia herrerae TaxID=1293975 RepID=A0AA89AFL7_9ASTE|nr:hypothetical protein RJ639_022446 [Escallonia herrerae]